MKSHILKCIVVGISIIGLSACAHKQSAQSADQTGANGDQTQSYAMNPNGDYDSQNGQNGEIVNSMHAPSNQTYYFDYDSNQVRAKDIPFINSQANYLATHPNAKVRLEGNTDERGSREYNIGLGWRRDQAVANYLKQQGVRDNQINQVSYGKEKPAVTGNDESTWRLNRRVQLFYVVK